MFTESISGQIVYEPIFLNQCTDKLDETQFWWLTDSAGIYGPDTIKYRSVVLPKVGDYNLYFEVDEEPIKISINNYELIKDTFLVKRINHIIFVSTPPHSEYFDCDSLAKGRIVDYYYSGRKRIEGVFKDGQLIDSMFTYFRNGQIDEIFIPRKKNWKRVEFYKHGQVKSIYDTKKRYSKEYYSNGQIKKESSWTRKYKSTILEYFQNGFLSLMQNDKKLERYNENRILREKIIRKEILKFDRIFAKKSSYRKRKFYNYKWSFFDINGILERKIIFNGSDFMLRSFPDNIDQIEDYMINEIIFFKDGIVYKKLKFLFDEEKIDELKELNIYFTEHRIKE
jgi:antitoxin component YwqK of YwqJK toxin-antitoxin module